MLKALVLLAIVALLASFAQTQDDFDNLEWPHNLNEIYEDLEYSQQTLSRTKNFTICFSSCSGVYLYATPQYTTLK
jgi:hypothetical protein